MSVTLIDRIRDLIALGKTEQSLDELYNYVKENNADTIDQLVMLQNRMKTLQRNVQMGTMDDEAEARERARINDAVLKLLPQLTPEYMAQFSRATAEPAPNNNKMYYIIGGVGLLLLFILSIALCGDDGDEPADTATTTTTQSAQPAAQTAGDESADLINSVREAHNGIAAWMANSRNGEEVSVFIIHDDNLTCDEQVDGQVKASFEIQGIEGDKIVMVDHGRDLYLRISNSRAEFRNGENGPWSFLATGGWATQQ